MSNIIDTSLLQKINTNPCNEYDAQQNWGAVRQILTQIAGTNILVGGTEVSLKQQTKYTLPAVIGHMRVSSILVQPAAANDWMGIVLGRIIDNRLGAHPDVDDVMFFVHGRNGRLIDLAAGDRCAYSIDHRGERFLISDYSNAGAGGGGDTIYVSDGTTTYEITTQSAVFWCRAQHNWSESGYVSVKLLQDGYGGTEVGNAFNAHFRNDATAGRKHYDPNVVVGQDIRCTIDTDGTVIVTDAQAYDLPIGTVVATVRDPVSGSYAREYTKGGWGAADGSGNATGKGGSGLDWQGYYMFAKTVTRPSPGDVSTGDKIAAGSHTHSNSLTIGSSSTGITLDIDDHPNHQHKVGCATTTYDVAGGGGTYLGLINLVDQHSLGGPIYTGGMASFDDAGPHTHTAMNGYEHSFLLSDSGHSHTVGGSLGNAHSDPAKFQIYWIERLNNSVEAGGA